MNDAPHPYRIARWDYGRAAWCRPVAMGILANSLTEGKRRRAIMSMNKSVFPWHWIRVLLPFTLISDTARYALITTRIANFSRHSVGAQNLIYFLLQFNTIRPPLFLNSYRPRRVSDDSSLARSPECQLDEGTSNGRWNGFMNENGFQ